MLQNMYLEMKMFFKFSESNLWMIWIWIIGDMKQWKYFLLQIKTNKFQERDLKIILNISRIVTEITNTNEILSWNWQNGNDD